MGSYGGPNISRDGLVLYLDAANVKSFRGEPTINYLSDGINGMNVVTGNNWFGYVPSTVGNSEFGTPIKRYITSGTSYMYSRDEVLDDDLVTLSEKTVTFSLYIKRLEGAATGRIRIYDNVSGYSYYTVNVTTEFQRFSGTKTLGANPTRIFVMIDNTGGGTYDIHSPQLEEKPYATPFVDGTRGTSVSTGGGWKDLSGNGNDGTLVGGPTYSSDNWGTLAFDGSGKKATLSVPFGQSNYTTVSVWYKRDETNSSTLWRTIFSTSSTNIHHLISQSTSRSLGIWDGSFKNFAYIPPIDGNFHNYTVIYQSGVNATLYVDGFLISTVNTSLDLVTSPIGTIGNWAGGTYWVGNLNLPVIYSRALTSEEILQNYNATKSRFGL